MLNSQKFAIKLSETRSRLNEITGLEGDKYTEEIQAEEKKLLAEYRTTEKRYQSALLAEGEEEKRNRELHPDPEMRERLQLRERASLGRYIKAALEDRSVKGAEHELAEAAGVDGIPIELWDVPEQRSEERGGQRGPFDGGCELAAPATENLQPERGSAAFGVDAEREERDLRQRNAQHRAHGGRGRRRERRSRNGRELHRPDHHAAPGRRCLEAEA